MSLLIKSNIFNSKPLHLGPLPTCINNRLIFGPFLERKRDECEKGRVQENGVGRREDSLILVSRLAQLIEVAWRANIKLQING